VKRDVLLRKVVEPSPSGRVHDMECDCYEWRHGWMESTPEYLPRIGCPRCRGTGRVSKRLSRREARAIVTFSRQCDKAYRRAMQYAVQQRRLEYRKWWKQNFGDITEWMW
jgi:hypothetical protein